MLHLTADIFASIISVSVEVFSHFEITAQNQLVIILPVQVLNLQQLDSIYDPFHRHASSLMSSFLTLYPISLYSALVSDVHPYPCEIWKLSFHHNYDVILLQYHLIPIPLVFPHSRSVSFQSSSSPTFIFIFRFRFILILSISFVYCTV